MSKDFVKTACLAEATFTASCAKTVASKTYAVFTKFFHIFNFIFLKTAHVTTGLKADFYLVRPQIFL